MEYYATITYIFVAESNEAAWAYVDKQFVNKHLDDVLSAQVNLVTANGPAPVAHPVPILKKNTEDKVNG